jgi:hypothetical protein
MNAENEDGGGDGVYAGDILREILIVALPARALL